MERGWEQIGSWFPAENVLWAEPCHFVLDMTPHDVRGDWWANVNSCLLISALSSSTFDPWLHEVILGAQHWSHCVDLRAWKKATGTKLQADVHVVLKFSREKKKKPSSQQEKVGDEQHVQARVPEHRVLTAEERDAPQSWPRGCSSALGPWDDP